MKPGRPQRTIGWGARRAEAFLQDDHHPAPLIAAPDSQSLGHLVLHGCCCCGGASGPAPSPLLPPKSFERLWLRNSGVSRRTGGYSVSSFRGNYTKPPVAKRTMKPQYKMAASREFRSSQRSDPGRAGAE